MFKKIILKEITSKKKNKGVYKYVHLFYNKQHILLHVSATGHGHRQGCVL